VRSPEKREKEKKKNSRDTVKFNLPRSAARRRGGGRKRKLTSKSHIVKRCEVLPKVFIANLRKREGKGKKRRGGGGKEEARSPMREMNCCREEKKREGGAARRDSPLTPVDPRAAKKKEERKRINVGLFVVPFSCFMTQEEKKKERGETPGTARTEGSALC